MQRSHFALNRNELLLNMAQQDHHNKSKYISKPTKEKVKPPDLSHSRFPRYKPKAERVFHPSVHSSFQKVSL